MAKSWYMHTIDGKPAFYAERNQQICYAMRRQNIPILVESLREIRRHQDQTMAYRLGEGMQAKRGDYGYITFPKHAVKRRRSR